MLCPARVAVSSPAVGRLLHASLPPSLLQVCPLLSHPPPAHGLGVQPEGDGSQVRPPSHPSLLCPLHSPPIVCFLLPACLSLPQPLRIRSCHSLQVLPSGCALKLSGGSGPGSGPQEGAVTAAGRHCTTACSQAEPPGSGGGGQGRGGEERRLPCPEDRAAHSHAGHCHSAWRLLLRPAQQHAVLPDSCAEPAARGPCAEAAALHLPPP